MNKQILKDRILAECDEDDVGLWVIIWELENQGVQNRHLKEETLTFIELLMNDGLISAGHVRVVEQENRAVFDHWNLTPSETVARISKEWDKLGRLPTIGDIVYFTITDKGMEYLRTIANDTPNSESV
ncbi:MAG TPA: hypothetical protein PLY93_07505 [Turneriella sp.]|nr:hypothetical protein [Turneriella sp.]